MVTERRAPRSPWRDPSDAKRLMRDTLRVAAALYAFAVPACTRPAELTLPPAAPMPVASAERPERVAADSGLLAALAGRMPGTTIEAVQGPPPGSPIRIRCGLGTPDGHPALLVLDGVVLGLRPDGTVDHTAAQAALAGVEVGEVESVVVVKSAEAVRRFGPGGHRGAILIETSRRGRP